MPKSSNSRLLRAPGRGQHPGAETVKRILPRLLAARSLRLTTPPGENALSWVDDVASAAEAAADDRNNLTQVLSVHLAKVLQAMHDKLPIIPVGSSGTHDLAPIHEFLTNCLADWTRQLVELKDFINASPELHDMAGVQPLNELFDYAVAVTENAYQEYSHGFSSSPNVSIVYSTREAAERTLNACTRFPTTDRKRRRSAEITLDIPVEGFVLSHYLEILYVMFHEIFVHSVQNLFSEGARQAHGELCPFSEGFVDSMALRVLRKALGSVAGFPKAHAPYRARILEGIHRAHDDRYSQREIDKHMGDSGTVKLRYAMLARNDGRRLLERLEQFWMKDDVADGPCFDRLASLVLSLNALPWGKMERAFFVVQVDEALDSLDALRQGLDVPSPRQAKRLHALDRFARDGDEDALREAFSLTG